MFIHLLSSLPKEGREIIAPILNSASIEDIRIHKLVASLLMRAASEGFMHIIKREQRVLVFSMGEVIPAAEEIEDAEEVDDDREGDEYILYSGR